MDETTDSDNRSKPEPQKPNTDSDVKHKPRKLEHAHKCYVCKKFFTQLHGFYDAMCLQCGDLNYKKRLQTADMKGMTVLLTGARVKIGYEIGLMLLRAGAFVIMTSRFPKDSVLRYAREPDFASFKDRMHVYGVDFRMLSAVEKFCEHILKTYPRLDALINNAAQTIRRPPIFYQHLLRNETQPLPPSIPLSILPAAPSLSMPTQSAVKLLSHSQPSSSSSLNLLSLSSSKTESLSVDDTFSSLTTPSLLSKKSLDNSPASLYFPPLPSLQPQQHKQNDVHHTVAMEVELDEGKHEKTTATSTDLTASSPLDSSNLCLLPETIPQSVALSQLPLLPSDAPGFYPEETFPAGQYDSDHQQLDFRKETTWVMKMHQVSTVELAEVQAVNAMAPFILISKLTPLLYKHPIDRPAFIVNVSSMEGKFSKFKDPNHTHTNMAKAALNMMTKTSYKEYAEHGVYMTAVDTGWVTDEYPVRDQPKTTGHEIPFQPPLDEIDGAARVLDPIFSALNGGKIERGVFLKDYAPCDW